jgi:hypothetical protein
LPFASTDVGRSEGFGEQQRLPGMTGRLAGCPTKMAS